MSNHMHRSHDVSILLYHPNCPAKYRRAVFPAEVDTALRDFCLEIAARYDITFLEVGTGRNHVHFLVQTIPAYSPSKLARIITSLTAREVFRRGPAFKTFLGGGASSGPTGPISVRSAGTVAKVRSDATSLAKGAKWSTPSSIRNNSAYSERTRPVPSDTRRLAAG